MKKSLFLLPLVVVLSLTACTSDNSAEVTESASSASSESLPNGGTWQSADIQPTSMPSTMNQPVAAQPSYTPASTTTTTPSYNNTQNYSSQKNVGHCQIVRDSSGTPLYAQMTKGCYTDSTYTVGPQDTLYFISFLAGKSPSEIAALNNISTTTKLKVGRSIRMR